MNQSYMNVSLFLREFPDFLRHYPDLMGRVSDSQRVFIIILTLTTLNVLRSVGHRN